MGHGKKLQAQRLQYAVLLFFEGLLNNQCKNPPSLIERST